MSLIHKFNFSKKITSIVSLSVLWLYLLVWAFYFLFANIVGISLVVYVMWGVAGDCSYDLKRHWDVYGFKLGNFWGCTLTKAESSFLLLEAPIDIAFIVGCFKSRLEQTNRRWVLVCGLFACWYAFIINFLFFQKTGNFMPQYGYFLLILLIPGFILNLKYAGVWSRRSNQDKP